MRIDGSRLVSTHIVVRIDLVSYDPQHIYGMTSNDAKIVTKAISLTLDL